MQKYKQVLSGRAGVGNSGGSMDPAHRARADSRQPSFQRDRARAAGNLALAAGVASSRPGRRGRRRAAARCAAEGDGVSPFGGRDETSRRSSRRLARGVSAGPSASRGRRSWTRDCWSGRFTSGSIASCCRTGVPVVEFDFTGPRGRRVWLLLEPREVSVCVTPPGFDSDLIVRADLAFFYRVWLGHIEYDAAIRCRSVVVEGPPALAKQLPRWFMWSPMARFVREREHPVAHASGLVRAVDRRAV